MLFKEFLHSHSVLLDGATGTELQKRGLPAGVRPADWNISHPAEVQAVHKAYFDAGSNLVFTNTFGVYETAYTQAEMEEIIFAAVQNVRFAAEQSAGTQEKFVALDISPLGKLLKPWGELDFEEAVKLFATAVKIGVRAGVDCIVIETFTDCYETKAALLAAKENADLPVLVSNAYGEDGKLMTGATPAVMVAMLEGMGADAIGVNCSLGPKQLRPIVEEYLRLASVSVLCKPNAGLPVMCNGVPSYDMTPEEFGAEMADFAKMGVRLLGGCCGTNPDFIRTVVQTCGTLPLHTVTQKKHTVVTSNTRTAQIGGKPLLIGERINPTGKKKLKEALRAGDMEYIRNEAIRQTEAGVHILDVNVGLPEIDEVALLTEAVQTVQSVTDLPLQIDTSNPAAMEAAARRYIGKPLLNSVSGKEESMEAVFPILKKYGGVAVALTLDENGIPDTAEGRIAIAQKIIDRAEKYGIGKENLLFDPLTLSVASMTDAPRETLAAVQMLTEMGCHTSLGVSNVSFGLPARDGLNATFFACALEKRLSAAIMNPFSVDMMRTYYAYCALHGLDTNCSDYIAFCDKNPVQTVTPSASAQMPAQSQSAEAKPTFTPLQEAILRGRTATAQTLTEELIKTVEPLEIVNQHILPALDTVGIRFEKNQIFLPQLLMSAEAAKTAFAVIKQNTPQKEPDGKIVILATVHGDIHDIGKNIVHLLLENYGFNVHDLGKDVPAETIVEEAVRTHAPFVGLSALMTTTVPAMEETIRLLKKDAPWVKTIVGGAVLTAEYAEKIGADFYAKDAMDTVRICGEK